MSRNCFDISGIPTIWFSLRYQSNHYANNFPAFPIGLEITYIVEGAVLWQQQGHPAEMLEPGTILLSPRQIPFSISCPEGRHVHETVGLHLYLTDKPAGDHVISLPPYLPPSPDHASIHRLIRKIIHVRALRGSHWEMECGGLALELLAELARASEEKPAQEDLSPGYERYARQTFSYIAQHLHERITVSELAAQLKISPGHLSHVFKEATGQTLITAINRMKLNRMQELMVTQGLPLRQAAASVGWEDESYASRLFKQHYGLSPTQYLHTHTMDVQED